MIDPTPGDSPLALPLTDAEREARIEELLVSGLDEYFAGRMDHAVNIWTRVLFLDRANDRARAYIDRARRLVVVCLAAFPQPPHASAIDHDRDAEFMRFVDALARCPG